MHLIGFGMIGEGFVNGNEHLQPGESFLLAFTLILIVSFRFCFFPLRNFEGVGLSLSSFAGLTVAPYWYTYRLRRGRQRPHVHLYVALAFRRAFHDRL